jgi:hypothetical protein
MTITINGRVLYKVSTLWEVIIRLTAAAVVTFILIIIRVLMISRSWMVLRDACLGCCSSAMG